MSTRNLAGRLKKLGGPPACRGTRKIVDRMRNYSDPELPPYEYTAAADRCPVCGVLGCGVNVIDLVIVRTREEADAMLALSGGGRHDN